MQHAAEKAVVLSSDKPMVRRGERGFFPSAGIWVSILAAKAEGGLLLAFGMSLATSEDA
ncbi:hypothetical protein PMIN04_007861 [Paraphaeosphaeria minitans]